MPKPPYRTIVYVDGFNFYYGEVRGTLWKWLDPAALFKKILGPQNKLEKVKYFPARVQPSPRDPNVNVRQDAYLRALQAHCPAGRTALRAFPAPSDFDGERQLPSTLEVWKNEKRLGRESTMPGRTPTTAPSSCPTIQASRSPCGW